MQRRLMEVDFFFLSIIKSLPEESVTPLLILFQAAKTARTDIQRFRSMREVQLVGEKKKENPHSNIFSHWKEAESDAQCTEDAHTLDYVIFSTPGENLKIVEVRL